MRESGPPASESIQDEKLSVDVEESSSLADDLLKGESAGAGGESRCRSGARCRKARRKCPCATPGIKGRHMRLCGRKPFDNRRMRYSRGCGRQVSLKDVVTG